MIRVGSRSCTRIAQAWCSAWQPWLPTCRRKPPRSSQGGTSYYRPGLYVRQIVPSGTGLKSWLFAAIKLIAPQFPIAGELEGPVNEASAALNANLQGAARDQLARIVSKLLQSGAALDLKRWMAGVDLTADRAGFLLAHDLETAAEIIKASDEASSVVGGQERIKELVLFSVSEQYFQLRQKLKIAVDS